MVSCLSVSVVRYSLFVFDGCCSLVLSFVGFVGVCRLLLVGLCLSLLSFVVCCLLFVCWCLAFVFVVVC